MKISDEPAKKPSDPIPEKAETSPEKTEPTVSGLQVSRAAQFLKELAKVSLPTSNAAPGLPGSFLFTTKPSAFRSNLFDEAVLTKSRELEAQITTLRRQVEEQALTLQAEKTSAVEKEQKITTLETSLAELREKERLSFLFSRVNQKAQGTLLQSEEFRSQFLNNKECSVFIMSIDIRRSTELMLKARHPEKFAFFIITLCSELMDIVIESYGVIDKFTGDGILSFFKIFILVQMQGTML
jgi:hypothetical protein